MSMDGLLQDKRALIVGGSGMIGSSIARLFTRHGAAVALHYCRNRPDAEALLREVDAIAPGGCLVQADITQPEEAESLVASAIRQLGHIDVVVNTAGIARDSAVQFLSPADWHAVLQVNLHGPFYVCRAVRAHLKSRRSGKIVNVASITGLTGQDLRVNYGASKAALIAFTKTLARDLGPAGIQVNAIAPQIVEGGLSRSAAVRYLKETREQTPRGRLGSGMDVAQAALYLASPMSDFIVGAVLHVTGGLVTHQV